MSTPRLEIDLLKIHHNASKLVKSMSLLGISVTGITKVSLGSSEIARTMLRAGVKDIGDSRLENIESMHNSGIKASMVLIRSPSLSQVDLVIMNANMSFNAELEVIKMLSAAAVNKKCNHNVVLMVELGDLREGIMIDDIEEFVREVLQLPNIIFKGIGTNLGCQNGVIPNIKNMAMLSDLAVAIELMFDIKIDIVSGGNSSNLLWAMSGVNLGRINNLRLGEAILLGRHPTNNEPIEGLFTDAFTFIAEVIESKLKPSQPWGCVGNATFDGKIRPKRSEFLSQVIFAVGRQDIDPDGLIPYADIEILGASSDHLVVDGRNENLAVGSEMSFHPNYSALLRAMTSPSVLKVFSSENFLSAKV